MRPRQASVLGQIAYCTRLRPMIQRPNWWPNPPRPPSEANYTIPGGATTVSTAASFETEFLSGTAKDIKVLNGSYSRTGPLTAGAGHKIWCETATGVSFDFGLLFRDRANWEVHGGSWAITDVNKLASDGGGTPKTGAIVTWISSANTNKDARVSDVTADITRLGRYCIFLGYPGGAKVERCVLKNAMDGGLYAYNNGAGTASTWLTSNISIDTISDLEISGIYRPTRGDQDGKDEYGITVGHPVTNGVKRIRARDIGWGGILTIGKHANTAWTDLDADVVYGTIPVGSPTNPADGGKITGQGMYLERTTRNCTFERFRFGPDIQRGAANEWDEDQNYLLTATYTVGNSTMSVDHGRFDAQIPTSGTIYVSEAAVAISYTGWNAGAKQFTGCSGGSGGPWSAGTLVSTWPGGRHAATDVVIHRGWIDAATTRTPARPRRGVTYDDGTLRPIFRDVIVRGVDDAAVLDNTGVPHAQNAGQSQATLAYIDASNKTSAAVFVTYPAS
jgi:hypothetical protein